MHDFQSLIFRAASHWSAVAGLVLLALGLLCTLQGFRFARLLLTIACVGGGFVLGGIAAGLTGLPPIVALISAAGLGILALKRYRVGLALASMFTFGALAQYLGVQLGLRPNIVLVAAGVGAAVGLSMTWVCHRPLPVILTTLQGAGLLIVGFVGLTNALAPSLGLTFIDWAANTRLMVPALMLMLCVLGYSVQANAQQGDLEAGGTPGWNSPEAS